MGIEAVVTVVSQHKHITFWNKHGFHLVIVRLQHKFLILDYSVDNQLAITNLSKNKESSNYNPTNTNILQHSKLVTQTNRRHYH
jgi:hypothetical protein